MAQTEEPSFARKKKRRVVALPAVDVPNTLASVASKFYTHRRLTTGGALTKAKNMVGKGALPAEAANHVSKMAKGLTAEHDLCTSFTARAGLVQSDLRARPNPSPIHPTADLLVSRSGKTIATSQVKNGQAQYVNRAHASGKYGNGIVANQEAVNALEKAGHIRLGEIPTRLSFGGVDSTELSAIETRVETVSMLTKMLSGDTCRDLISPTLIAMKAGATDAINTIGLNLVVDIAEALATGKTVDVAESLANAAKIGGKVLIRTTAVTWSHVQKFLRHAKSAFSSRLIHRIASSTLAMSAIADVVVETVFDLYAVFRGQLDWDTFFRRLGVTTIQAVGGLAGASLAVVLGANLAWPARVILLLIGAWLGSKGGRLLGEYIFEESPVTTQPHSV